MLVDKDFSIMASDWLAAVLPANQKPGLKILVNWPGCYNGIFLVIQVPGKFEAVVLLLHHLSHYTLLSLCAGNPPVNDGLLKVLVMQIFDDFFVVGLKTLSNNRVKIWDFLTHYGLVSPYGNIDLGQHWLS